MHNLTRTLKSPFPKAQNFTSPDLTKELQTNQNLYLTHDTNNFPFLSTTNCFVSESLNSSPYLVRSSFYAVPGDANLFNAINLPFYVVFQPFSHKQEIYEANQKGLECFECGSYFNAYSQTEKDAKGEFFTCNLCNYQNYLTFYGSSLHNSLSATGNLFKTFSRPTFEFPHAEKKIKEEKTMVEDTFFGDVVFNHAVIIFALHKSELRRVEEIRKIIEDENFEELYRKVCILVFDDSVHFYKVNREHDTDCTQNENIENRLENICLENNSNDEKYWVEENIVSDIPFLESSYFHCKNDALKILDFIQNSDSETYGSNFDNVLKSIYLLSFYAIGTKAVLFFEPQNVDGSLNNAEKYTEKMVTNNCALYYFNSANNDGLSVPAQTKSNSTATNTLNMNFINFIYNSSGSFLTNLRYLLTKSFYDVKIKIKTSDALRKKDIFTNTFLENNLEIKFPNMDSNSTIGFSFFIDETMKESQKVFIQGIFEYKTHDGKGKVLVVNQGYQATYKLSSIYGNLTMDTIFSFYSKKLCSNILDSTETHLKKDLVHALKFYRKKAENISNTQMVLPENIKLLPLLISCLLKKNFMGGTVLRETLGLSVERNLRFFYPRIFSLSDFFLEGEIICMRASFLGLKEDDFYVIENGYKMIIFYNGNHMFDNNLAGNQNNDDTSNISSAINMNNILNFNNELPNKEKLFEDEEWTAILDLKSKFESEYDREMSIELHKRNSVFVLESMVEDKMNGISDYNEFLMELHFLVKE